MMKNYDGFNIGTIVKRHTWTPQLFSIRVQVPLLEYSAGQFTKLALYDDQGELIRRAYSIVNSPLDHQQTGELEFLIITDETGLLSPKLNQLKIGQSILVGQTASGFMTLSEIPPETKNLWLISSGTGIGPYLSMLEKLLKMDTFKKSF